MAGYGKKAQAKVKRAMHKMKEGKLLSGRSKKRVKSRRQAIAIGLSEARKAGGKVPTASKTDANAKKKSAIAKNERQLRRKNLAPQKENWLLREIQAPRKEPRLKVLRACDLEKKRRSA